MSAFAQPDPSQRWIDRAFAGSASVPELMASLASVEQLVVNHWLRHESTVLPVNLMTEDDLVQ